MKIANILAVAALCIGFSACNADEEALTNVAPFELSYDEDQVPGNYIFSDFNDQFQINFGVSDLGITTASVANRAVEGAWGTIKAVSLKDGKGSAVYTAKDFNIGDDGKVKNQEFKITVGDISKVLNVSFVSPWLDLASLKEGETVQTITWNKGSYLDGNLTLIQARPLQDTLTFKINVDKWEDVSEANWTVQSKVGKNGAYSPLTYVAKDKNQSIMIIKSLKEWNLKAKDTVYVKATITHKTKVREKEVSYVIQNFSSVLSSSITPAVTFNPSVSKTTADTLSFQTIVLKDEKKNTRQTRTWLKANKGTWEASYTVGQSKTVLQLPNAPVVVKSNDTLSRVDIVNNFGKLAGVAQYDTINVTANFIFDGVKYPIKKSFVVGK